MDTDLIFQNISKFINLDKAETDFFISILQYKLVKKKQFLLRPGEICKYKIFVTAGCLKNYTVDENGFEHIGMFAVESWWTGDFHSFLTSKPSVHYIEALENTEVLLISKENAEKLYEKIPKFERFFRIQFQKALVSLYQRIHLGISLSAGERYLQFIDKYPQLEQRITQKQVAAYLGITPEYLSFIRRRVVKK